MKKKISIIRIQEGNAVARAQSFADQGADMILAIDQSSDDAAHDAAIDQEREIVRRVGIPVWGAGAVKRVEDVKKILYAGCSKAVLNASISSNMDMLEEVSKRFGKDKIAVCICALDTPPDAEMQQRIDQYASCTVDIRNEEVILHPDEEYSCSITWEDLKKGPDGLVPTVVQDFATNEVLMVAYMNEASFIATITSGRMTYWSRSRQELWEKGLTSGHFQYLKELRYDCDADTLLARVVQIGAACHTGARSCFYRTALKKDTPERSTMHVLEDVFATIEDRKVHPKEGSYTNYLFDKGIDKVLKKVGEETAEIIIAAKNPNPEETKYEIADFLYHMMVLMSQKGLTWEDIAQELANRE